MARNRSVEYEDVAKACAQLFAEGEAVSFAKVYALIGNRGGNAIVNGYIKQWREEVAGQLQAKRSNPELSPELVDASDALLARLYKLALADAEKAFDAAREQLARDREDWQRQIDLAEEAREAAMNRSAEFERQLEVARAAAEAREQAYLELETRHAETTAKLAAREDQIAAMREDQARIVATLESERAQHSLEYAALQQRHEAALVAERERHEAALQVEQTKMAGELAREREILAGERKHFAATTDRIRQENKAELSELQEKVTQLTTDLASSRETAETYRKQTWQLRDELNLLRGRVEASEAMLARFTERKGRRKPTEAAPE